MTLSKRTRSFGLSATLVALGLLLNVIVFLIVDSRANRRYPIRIEIDGNQVSARIGEQPAAVARFPGLEAQDLAIELRHSAVPRYDGGIDNLRVYDAEGNVVYAPRFPRRLPNQMLAPDSLWHYNWRGQLAVIQPPQGGRLPNDPTDIRRRNTPLFFDVELPPNGVVTLDMVNSTQIKVGLLRRDDDAREKQQMRDGVMMVCDGNSLSWVQLNGGREGLAVGGEPFEWREPWEDFASARMWRQFACPYIAGMELLWNYGRWLALLALVALLVRLAVMLIPSRKRAAPQPTQASAPGEEVWTRRLAWARRGAGFRAVMVILIGLAGAGYSAYVADVLFERIPHIQDSVGYLLQAKAFSVGEIGFPVEEHLAPSFELRPRNFLERDGYLMGVYVNPAVGGYPLILTLGVLLGIPWLLNPFFAFVNICLAYGCVRRTANTATAFVVIVLLAASPWARLTASDMMVHESQLTLLLLAFLAMTSRHWLGYLGAGLALAFALNIRALDTAIFVVVIGVFLLAQLRQVGLRSTMLNAWVVAAAMAPGVYALHWQVTTFGIRTSSKTMGFIDTSSLWTMYLWMLGALTVLILGILAFVLLFPMLTRFYRDSVRDWSNYDESLPWVIGVVGTAILMALLGTIGRVWIMLSDLNLNLGWRNSDATAIRMEFLNRDFLGWEGYAGLALVAIMLLPFRKRWYDWVCLTWLAATLGCYYLLSAHGVVLSARYYYSAIFAASFLSARALGCLLATGRDLLMWLSGLRGTAARRLALVACLLVLIPVVEPSLYFLVTREAPNWFSRDGDAPRGTMTGRLHAALRENQQRYGLFYSLFVMRPNLFKEGVYGYNFNGFNNRLFKRIEQAGITRGLFLLGDSPDWRPPFYHVVHNEPIFGTRDGQPVMTGERIFALEKDERRNLLLLRRYANYPAYVFTWDGDRADFVLNKIEYTHGDEEYRVVALEGQAEPDAAPAIEPPSNVFRPMQRIRGLPLAGDLYMAPGGELLALDDRMKQLFIAEASSGDVLTYFALPWSESGFPQDPKQVAADSRGNVYIMGLSPRAVARYPLLASGEVRDETKIIPLPANPFRNPRDLAVMDDNTLLIADEAHPYLHRLTHDGERLEPWGNQDAIRGTIRSVLRLAAGPQGSWYLLSSRSDRVLQLDAQGEPMGDWAVPLRNTNKNASLASDGQGRVFISDPEASIVVTLNTRSGNAVPVGSHSLLGNPTGIAVDGTRLYAMAYHQRKVTHLSLSDLPQE